jgi:hypothetical protein
MAGHGGARKGAGRPKNATKHKQTAASLTELCADFAPQAFANLKILANGGFERVKLEYELQTIVPEPGETDAEGSPRRPYLAEVLVGRKVEYAEPDREANKYLIDRVHGKPRQAVELGNGDSGPLKIQVVYAQPHSDDPESAPGAGEDPPGDAPV